jgi:acyl carrier protein
MLPAAFVVLESLPLTPTGKLDRRALPAPDTRAYSSVEYQAPQTELEEALARIWQQVLDVERVGRLDNFFDLGGHSLLATRVVTRISHALDLELSLRVLFERPTIAALAEFIVREILDEMAMERQ